MRLNVGDTSSVNSITNRGYTGHEMDDEIGVINMNARIYDPFLGRFLSADPVLPDAYDMQSYNRYSYVVNNPLKYVDPTGNMYEDIHEEFFHGEGSQTFTILGDPNSGNEAIITNNVTYVSEILVVPFFGFSFGFGLGGGGSTDRQTVGVSFGLTTIERITVTIDTTVDYGQSESSDGRGDGNEGSHRSDSSLGFGRAIHNRIIILPENRNNNEQDQACNGFGCLPPNAPPTLENLQREVEQFRQILRRIIVDSCVRSLVCLITIQNSSNDEGDGVVEQEGSRNSSQDKRLSKNEEKKLKDAGEGAHKLKPRKNGSKFDLFKDQDGNIFVKPLDGSGPGDPTGLNINDF